ncbi:MAG: hypothetical protein KBG84_01355 [Planctomycetes bacterium]|nr:hypothetical protein [Planctomycetota bacterium]
MRTLGLSLLAILATTFALLSDGAPVGAEPSDKEESVGAPNRILAQVVDSVPKELRVKDGVLATANFGFELCDASSLFTKLKGKLPSNVEFNADKNTERQLWFSIDDGNTIGVIGSDGKINARVNIKDELRKLGSDAKDEKLSMGVVYVAASSKSKSSSLDDILKERLRVRVWRIRLLVSDGRGGRAWLPLGDVGASDVKFGEDKGAQQPLEPKDELPTPRMNRRSFSDMPPLPPGPDASDEEFDEYEKKMKPLKDVEDKWAPIRFRYLTAKNEKGQAREVFVICQEFLTSEVRVKLPDGFTITQYGEEIVVSGYGGAGEEGLKAALEGIATLAPKLKEKHCVLPMLRAISVPQLLDFLREAWASNLSTSLASFAR